VSDTNEPAAPTQSPGASRKQAFAATAERNAPLATAANADHR
jgi:hypothetical protein